MENNKKSRPQAHVSARYIFTLWVTFAAVNYLGQLFGGKTFAAPWWLNIHVITLGIIGSSILIWSWHFTVALARLRGAGDRAQNARLISYTLAVLLLVVGMSSRYTLLALIGMSAIAMVIIWHLVEIELALRAKFATRMVFLLKYYAAACACLCVGIALAYIPVITLNQGAIPLPSRLSVDGFISAHAIINILGFVGLTILGTLVTFGPTVLRTKMHPSAAALARWILPLLLIAVGSATLGASISLPRLTIISIAIYAAAAAAIVVPLAWSVRNAPPREAAAEVFFAGICWLISGWIAWFIAAVATVYSGGQSATLMGTLRINATVAITISLIGIVQMILGAMLYLFPVLIGGGPSATRYAIERQNRLKGIGVAALNIGGFLALTLPGAGAKVGWVIFALAALTLFINLINSSIAQTRFIRSKDVDRTES